ncbi:hypothetical protein [Halorientalis salina]|uniref:hypothetical protein n=1 Tax=Halorientalis salina TaxID=2932266 RepID=UPI0010AC8864|nr:hypothetical protein [Halorientalis salina]
MPETVTAYDGTTVTVEHVKPLANGGARFDIESEDGRKWRVDITRAGETELVTSWRDGELADLDVPDWLEDILERVRMAG